VNIRLERTSDPHTVEFSELLTGYGLAQHVSGATQNAGGTLDVVRLACSSGGHHRHRTLRPPPATMVIVATTAYTNQRDVRSQMLAVLRPGRFPYRPASILLCDVQSHNDLDGDVLASLYDSTITGLLDRQVPARSVTCRRCLSSLWFDDECRMAKRNVRRLERAARREGPLASSSSASTAWRAQRRAYFELLQRKQHTSEL